MLQNKSLKYKTLQGILLIVLVVILASGCGKDSAKTEAGEGAKKGKDKDNGKIVAIYEGGQVTQEEFDSFMGVTLFFYEQYAPYQADPQFQESILKQLITYKVLYDRVDEKKAKESEPKAEEQLVQLKQMFELQSGGAKLEDKLKEMNLTEKDVKDYISISMIVMEDLQDKVKDEDIKAEYDSILKDNKNAFDTATVSHILIGLKNPSTGEELRTKEEALTRAKEVQDKLKNGGDFAALAKEYSDDEGSKENGGTYADADINMWVPQFKKAAIELPLNTISDPVETDFGYHIMRVDARSTKTFDDLKEGLRSELAGKSVSDFVEKEIPAMIKEINLPKPPVEKGDSAEAETEKEQETTPKEDNK